MTLLTEFSANEEFFFVVFWTRLTNILVERDKEDKECSSEEEDSNEKGRMPTGDIKKNAALLGRVSVFGYKVASQQS